MMNFILNYILLVELVLMQLLQVFFELKKRNSFYYFLAKSVFICIFLKANSYPLEMFAKGK